MDLTKDRIDNAIDMLVTLTVEEIAGQENIDPSDALTSFLSTHTAEMLYDEENKLWWDGPSYIAEQYFSETSQKETE